VSGPSRPGRSAATKRRCVPPVQTPSLQRPVRRRRRRPQLLVRGPVSARSRAMHRCPRGLSGSDRLDEHEGADQFGMRCGGEHGRVPTHRLADQNRLPQFKLFDNGDNIGNGFPVPAGVRAGRARAAGAPRPGVPRAVRRCGPRLAVAGDDRCPCHGRRSSSPNVNHRSRTSLRSPHGGRHGRSWPFAAGDTVLTGAPSPCLPVGGLFVAPSLHRISALAR
jgi:hypothetical protein